MRNQKSNTSPGKYLSQAKQKGVILIQVLVFATIEVIVMGGLVSWAGTNVKVARSNLNREKAFQIAEAGIEYYRWHLAHANTDFQDGTGVAGPYVHNFTDRDGGIIGSFTLTITPPPIGSTKVIIQSVGNTVEQPTVTRTITAALAIPSLAKYAVVANANMRFGAGTEVFGPIHSNGGIRFDGLAHNTIVSALATYDDPDHSGGVEFGVHTHADLPPHYSPDIPPNSTVNDNFRTTEAPPSAVAARSDIFLSGRQTGVPAVDFAGITTNMATIKTSAQASGKYYASSGSLGYYILLRTNDTFDIYKVIALTTGNSSCNASMSAAADQTGWGTWSIKTKSLIAASVPFPANGLIFVEDNLWIDGQINSARLTVAAGQLPDVAANRKNITINGNLLYTDYTGNDAIALIAQNNINAGLDSLDTQRIDAALIAQNGRAGRYYYNSYCGSGYLHTLLTLDGMLATNLRYGFAYGSAASVVSGYQNRNIIYDSNLLYAPPPSFPLTSNQYSIISWKEK
jgi:hypothetical protein